MKTKIEKISVRDEMIQHIHAINKWLTPAYLENIDTKLLLNEILPAYREYFIDKLKKETKV